MVNFGAQLSLEKKEIARNALLYGAVQVSWHPLEWEEGFIDYGGLKKSLKCLKSTVDEQCKANNFVAKRFQSSESLVRLKKGYVRPQNKNTVDNSMPIPVLSMYVS